MTPFTYGETVSILIKTYFCIQMFESFADILTGLQDKLGLFQDSEKPSGVFYDLGSVSLLQNSQYIQGFGKPSLVAALVLPKYLSKSVGIEFLDGLFQKSLELKKIYDESSLPVTLDFIKDDFMANTQWASEADIVFANATCFEKEMVSSISTILNK